MNRYSNSYENEAPGYAEDVAAKMEAVRALEVANRLTLRSVMCEYDETMQLLHDEITKLSMTLESVLGPEPTDKRADGAVLTAQQSEIVTRAEAHNRALREALWRLQDVRGRIEL